MPHRSRVRSTRPGSESKEMAKKGGRENTVIVLISDVLQKGLFESQSFMGGLWNRLQNVLTNPQVEQSLIGLRAPLPACYRGKRRMAFNLYHCHPAHTVSLMDIERGLENAMRA